MRNGESGTRYVQSGERALDLLEALADAGGVAGLSRLAATSGLPLPTIHRLVRTLVGRGYVRQEPSRECALGPRLVHLGDAAGRQVGVWARPRLVALVDAVGETANLALLDGTQAVYIAEEPGRHSTRMFTEVGGGSRCTARLSARACSPPCPRAGPRGHAAHRSGGPHRRHHHRSGLLRARPRRRAPAGVRRRRGRAGGRGSGASPSRSTRGRPPPCRSPDPPPA